MLKNKKGFTLIELIIVMAIIGILAVVAIVALGSKSGEARNARRKADVAAILTATALQCNDSTDKIACDAGAINNRNQVSACDDPGSYMDFSSIFDPSGNTSICIGGETTECDYTMMLDTSNDYDPCNIQIEFWLENDAKTDSSRNCGKSSGIVFGQGC